MHLPLVTCESGLSNFPVGGKSALEGSVDEVGLGGSVDEVALGGSVDEVAS